jgi:signal transduction histidine kinase
LLPEAMRDKLFQSMVSVRRERDREGKSSEPHLGLGLYVARLIAEFHGGAIGAKNLASGDGVAVTASFRSA